MGISTKQSESRESLVQEHKAEFSFHDNLFVKYAYIVSSLLHNFLDSMNNNEVPAEPDVDSPTIDEPASKTEYKDSFFENIFDLDLDDRLDAIHAWYLSTLPEIANDRDSKQEENTTCILSEIKDSEESKAMVKGNYNLLTDADDSNLPPATSDDETLNYDSKSVKNLNQAFTKLWLTRNPSKDSHLPFKKRKSRWSIDAEMECEEILSNNEDHCCDHFNLHHLV